MSRWKRCGRSLTQLAQSTETIVHGTTVTTNAVLTLNGAKTGLLTTLNYRGETLEPLHVEDVREAVRAADVEAIATAFHVEHRRMYGYSLEDGTPVEFINVRVRATGVTERPNYAEEEYAGADASAALKGERPIHVPEKGAFRPVPVYDGHRTRHGNLITGPALIEQRNTTVLLTASYDYLCDGYGSFLLYGKGHESRLPSVLREVLS